MKYAFIALLALLSSGCYPLKSAAGHAGLLLRRRSLTDPVALDVRRWAFERLGLRRSRDYSTSTPVEGPVTWVVTAAPRLKLENYQWWFPFVGKVPYKGYFRREDAEREAARMERKGFDASVRGVTAYNTPLWISDPLPSSALRLPAGELAALLLHELAHGTVNYKDQASFNESAATFIGERAARDYLLERAPAEVAAYDEARRRSEARAAEIEAACAELELLYASALPEAEKLERRKAVFARVGEANNASLLAQRLYRRDLGAFERLHAKLGGSWPATIEALRALDRRDPAGHLARL